MTLVLEETKESNGELDVALLSMMADEYMRKIVSSVQAVDKSAVEISQENGIPVSTCYRRIRGLIELGFLRELRTVVTDDGKRYQTYKSALKQVSVKFSIDGISVVPTFNPPEERHVLATKWKETRSKIPTQSIEQQLSSRNLAYGACFSCVEHPSFPGVPAVTLHKDGICQVCGNPSTSLL